MIPDGLLVASKVSDATVGRIKTTGGIPYPDTGFCAEYFDHRATRHPADRILLLHGNFDSVGNLHLFIHELYCREFWNEVFCFCDTDAPVRVATFTDIATASASIALIGRHNAVMCWSS